MTAQEIIEEQIPIAIKKRPELAEEINAVIHFNITGPKGGHWTMDLTQKEDWIQPGFSGSPALTITIANDDFVKLRCGQLNGTVAVMNGKLQFKPFDFPMAMKVAKLMG
jgi:hypothetical protein